MPLSYTKLNDARIILGSFILLVGLVLLYQFVPAQGLGAVTDTNLLFILVSFILVGTGIALLAKARGVFGSGITLTMVGESYRSEALREQARGKAESTTRFTGVISEVRLTVDAGVEGPRSKNEEEILGRDIDVIAPKIAELLPKFKGPEIVE